MEKCRTQKQIEQIKINEKVIGVYLTCKEEIQTLRAYQTGERLRSCSAIVIRGYNGYFLKSYHTIIAYIPDGQNTCYDFLRYVYGYTATSAQHIAKFARDYNADSILSYKDI